jgi:hypothetical protein
MRATVMRHKERLTGTSRRPSRSTGSLTYERCRTPFVSHVLHGWDKLEEGLDLMRSQDETVIKPVIVI